MSDHPLTVLIVEDDPTAADLLTTRLRNLDCQPVVGLDAEEGFRLAVEAKPTFALLDLKLDDTARSGIDLLARLRADARTSHLPVFIHSIFVARSGDYPEAEAMANGFLLKPFKFADLKAIVEGFRAQVAK